jgi:hypothetical protein
VLLQQQHHSSNCGCTAVKWHFTLNEGYAAVCSQCSEVTAVARHHNILISEGKLPYTCSTQAVVVLQQKLRSPHKATLMNGRLQAWTQVHNTACITTPPFVC